MTTENPPPRAVSDRSVWIAFLLFVIVGSGGSVATRMTYAEVQPFWGATARFFFAALVFWVLAYFQKLALPKGRALWGAALFGALTVGLAFALGSWGLVETPASRYQILIATVPLMTVFLSAAQGLEALSVRGILGSLLAVIGIAVTVGGAGTAELSIPHVIAILGAAACLAEGGIVIKKLPPIPPVMTSAVAMTVGCVMLALFSLVAGETWTIPTLADTWIAFVYVVLCATIAPFLLYLYIVRRWSVSATSYGLVLVPLGTIVVAATLAGEQITWNFLVGTALVLVGVLIGALLPSTKKTPTVAAAEE